MMYVVPDSKHILLGRDWLEAIQLDWTEIKLSSESVSICLSHESKLDDLVDKHSDLFDGQLGLIKGVKADVELVRVLSQCIANHTESRMLYVQRLNRSRLQKDSVISPHELPLEGDVLL